MILDVASELFRIPDVNGPSTGVNTSTNSQNVSLDNNDILTSAPTELDDLIPAEDDYIDNFINSQSLQQCSYWHQEDSLNAPEFPSFSLEPTLSSGGDLCNISSFYPENGLNVPLLSPFITASISPSTGDDLLYNPSEDLDLPLSPLYHLESTLLSVGSVNDSSESISDFTSLSSGSEEEKYLNLRRKLKCDRCSAKKITCSGTIPCTRCLLDGTSCTVSFSRKHNPGTCIGCTRKKIPCVGSGDVCYACQLFDTPRLCKPASRNSMSLSTSGDGEISHVVPGKHGIEASSVDKFSGKRMTTHDWREVCIVVTETVV